MASHMVQWVKNHITPSHPCLRGLGHLNLVVYHVIPDLIQNEMKKGLRERTKQEKKKKYIYIYIFKQLLFREPRLLRKKADFNGWDRESTK